MSALLRRASIPHAFGGTGGLVDIAIENGRIARVAPAGTIEGEGRDLDGGMVWPCLVDLHTHLDKGHIWPRAWNPDGSREGALGAVGADREARWTAADVRARAEFGLRCAYAHGTRAIRTHLDSIGKQPDISWPVFRELRDEWRGRIEVQAVALFHPDAARDDPWLIRLADLVAASGGVLGGVPYPSEADWYLDRVFELAEQRGLDLDFHVDETGDPSSDCLLRIARTALRRKFPGRIVAGHCCSLAVQEREVADRTMDAVAEAGIAIVSLPMCNMYLQDRAPDRTPRWRGVTLLHELRSRGIAVSVASDNCRDPFYAYGDHDMVEVFREATRIAHLDHPLADWVRAVADTPAEVARLPARRIAAGEPADLILFRARTMHELLARPRDDRVVLRAGVAIDGTLPDYRELDSLMEPA